MDIKDYIGKKIALFCQSKEEFSDILLFYKDYNVYGVKEDMYKKSLPCLSIDIGWVQHSSKEYWEGEKFEIINASDILNPSKELKYDIF